MRPRKIFALLYGELLKQKLQTKNYQSTEKQINILFSQATANVYKTTRFTALFLLVRLTRDDIQQLKMQISCFVQVLSLL